MLKEILSKLFNWKSATPEPPQRPVIGIDLFDGHDEEAYISEIQSKLAAGADPNAMAWENPPLVTVSSQGFKKAAEILLAAGADVTATGKGGRTAFQHAATSMNIDLMRLLIDKGIDPRAMDDTGRNALGYFIHWPSSHVTKLPDYEARDAACLKFLLDLGMKPNHYDISTIYARRKHLIPQVPELVPVQEFENIVAAQDLPKLKEWLDRRIPPDFGVEYGAASPMRVAAEKNNIEMMDMLMEYGGSVESGSGGMTPIMAATYAGAKEAFMLLLRAGADTTKLFTYDRYPDTTLPELADLGKHEGMRAFVEHALAHRSDPIPEPDVVVHHKVVLGKPLHLKPPASR